MDPDSSSETSGRSDRTPIPGIELSKSISHAKRKNG